MATVERRHREAATEALMLGVDDETLMFHDGTNFDDDTNAELNQAGALAEVIADAEQRGRDAERADAVAWHRRHADRCQEAFEATEQSLTPTCVRDQLHSIGVCHGASADEMERGAHVGASKGGNDGNG